MYLGATVKAVWALKLPVVVETSVFVMLRQFESELVKVGRVKPDSKADCLV